MCMKILPCGDLFKVESLLILCPANEEPSGRIFWDHYEFFALIFKSSSIEKHVELNLECESVSSGSICNSFGFEFVAFMLLFRRVKRSATTTGRATSRSPISSLLTVTLAYFLTLLAKPMSFLSLVLSVTIEGEAK